MERSHKVLGISGWLEDPSSQCCLWYARLWYSVSLVGFYLTGISTETFFVDLCVYKCSGDLKALSYKTVWIMHITVIWNRREYFIFRHWKTAKVSINLYRTLSLSATHLLSHSQALLWLGYHIPSCHRPISSSLGITSKIPTSSYCTA